MEMFSKISSKFGQYNNSLIHDDLRTDKRKKALFLVSFYLIVFSTFLTIISQLPAIATRQITQVFQVGWIIVFIPLLMLDCKRVLKLLFFIVCLLFPFFVYCGLAILFGIKSFVYSGSMHIFMCCYLFIIFGTFSKYKNDKTTRLICFSFIIATIIYASVVFLTKLKGYDLSNEIYAFGSKNSAGPIFMSAAILSFFVFDKRNWQSILIKWAVFSFFVVIIALSKNRSVLIIIPIIAFIFLFYDVKNITISLIVLFAFCGGLIMLFAVPQLRETIINNIFLNHKTDLDSIFSGRLSQIIVHMQNIKPVLGTGNSYFDCMVLSFLCTFGSIGFISLLPFLIFPFVIIFTYTKKVKFTTIKPIIAALSVLFITSSLLEGYGFIGPGAKVFIFWFFVGNYSYDVFLFSKKKKIICNYDKISLKITRIPSKGLIYSLQLLFLSISTIALSIVAVSASIGGTVLDKLPETNEIADYVEVKNAEIISPIHSMCVGQKITYSVRFDPVDAEETITYWSTGWIQEPIISVNAYTGEVSANNIGTALLLMNRIRDRNGIYIRFPVVTLDNYTFDKAHISTKEFCHSFSNTSDEEISLKIGCTKKIYYDNYYIPNESLISFVSSDETVAKVENGLIKAKGTGKCVISALIKGKENCSSVNKITVNVSDGSFIPVTSLNMNYEKEIYQYNEYNISPIFNSDASDKNFSVEITGINYKLSNNRLTFFSPGTANIKVSSDSNPSVFDEKTIQVLKNSPDHFECQTNRMLIGETKNASDLGLYLVFKNSYKKIVTDDDLNFDASDFTNRAWTEKNGLIKNRTTIKGIKKGIISLTFTSKIDKEITNTFNITVSKYTQSEYDTLTKNIGSASISVIYIFALLFSFFVPAKRKWILPSILLGFTSIYVLINLLLYGFSTFTIIISSIIIGICFLTILLRLILKEKIPLKFLENPLELSTKSIFEQTQQRFFQIEI